MLTWHHLILFVANSFLHLQIVTTNIISLQDASLQEISGGQCKSDLKRAFAIVENNGVTHVVVATNDSDYAIWTKEISHAITFFSLPKVNEQELSGGGTDNFLVNIELSNHSTMARQISQPGGPIKPFGEGFSQALQSTKYQGAG